MPNRSAAGMKTVLLVDDDPGMLEFLERVIRAEGFKTLTETDGLKAVEAMRRSLPDAAVMDLMLPSYGGIEMLRELRRGATAAIPIVVVTARYTSPADQEAVLAVPNVARYFQKPVDPKALVEALHRILKTKGPGSR